MTDIGKNFRGSIGYEIEETYGGGLPELITSLKRFSDYVESATVRAPDIHTNIRTIEKPELDLFTRTVSNYEIDTTFILQNNAGTITLLENLCKRDATTGELASFYIELKADKSYYKAKGCIPSSVSITGARGEPYRCSVTFSVASIDTTDTTGTPLAAKSGSPVLLFNEAGSILFDGAAIAYITDTTTINIAQNPEDIYNVGSWDKKASIAGPLDITGTCDISLDEGGSAHFNRVLSVVEKTIVITTGGTGAPVLTLNGVVFDSAEITTDNAASAMMTSAPFTAKTLTISTVA